MRYGARTHVLPRWDTSTARSGKVKTFAGICGSSRMDKTPGIEAVTARSDRELSVSCVGFGLSGTISATPGVCNPG
jgi:hypothetical protein